jgi:flagellar biosynthesis chaperone FliJ
MRAFRFHLQRILEFRHTKLTEEERKLKLLLMELSAIERQIEAVRSERHQSLSFLTSKTRSASATPDSTG